MSIYDYWAGRNAAEASAAMGEFMLRRDMERERADNERVFRKATRTMEGLCTRVCSEIKWKTQFKASVSGWGYKADTFKKELLRIAGDTQEIRDFIKEQGVKSHLD